VGVLEKSLVGVLAALVVLCGMIPDGLHNDVPQRAGA